MPSWRTGMGAMRQWESVSLKGNVLLKKRICDPQNGCVNVERKERSREETDEENKNRV